MKILGGKLILTKMVREREKGGGGRGGGEKVFKYPPLNVTRVNPEVKYEAVMIGHLVFF